MSVLNLDDFDKLMQPFVLSSGMHIAVGVSGGADSLCLTLLLSEWAQKHKIELTAITINHNLRAVACQEAEAVHRFLTQKNVDESYKISYIYRWKIVTIAQKHQRILRPFFGFQKIPQSWI